MDYGAVSPQDYGKLNPLSSEEQKAITMGLSAAEVKFLTALSDLELKRLEKVAGILKGAN